MISKGSGKNYTVIVQKILPVKGSTLKKDNYKYLKICSKTEF